MLENELWGNTIENWGISILIILGALMLTPTLLKAMTMPMSQTITKMVLLMIGIILLACPLDCFPQ